VGRGSIYSPLPWNWKDQLLPGNKGKSNGLKRDVAKKGRVHTHLKGSSFFELDRAVKILQKWGRHPAECKRKKELCKRG